MNTEQLRIGMKVKHPHYGEGVVRTIGERTADVMFEDGARTVAPEGSGLVPAEPLVNISGLETSLDSLVARVARAVIDELGIELPGAVVQELGSRWRDGTMILKPADESLQAKEVPLETFFHKIVLMRNNLRVLEQKLNSHEQLTDAEKVELQQYVTRCYGSMTTFNVLFARREDGFNS